MFVEQTHEIRHEWRDNERPMRFTDTRLDEQERAISLKMVPMSLVMEGSSSKSYLLNLIDTPGTLPSCVHLCYASVNSWQLVAQTRPCQQECAESLASREGVQEHHMNARAAVLTSCWMHFAGHINFNDEVSAALRLADGMLLVVDAAEGVMVVTEKAIKQAIMEGLPICLLISKVQDSPMLWTTSIWKHSKRVVSCNSFYIFSPPACVYSGCSDAFMAWQVDRLITELKLPPADAYHKLRHTIEEVNALITTYSGGSDDLLVRSQNPFMARQLFSIAGIFAHWPLLVFLSRKKHQRRQHLAVYSTLYLVVCLSIRQAKQLQDAARTRVTESGSQSLPPFVAA